MLKNFWDFLQNTQKQIFLFLSDLHEILPLLLKQCFTYFIETVGLAQTYENGIPEKWDPKVGPYDKTLGWDPMVAPWAGTLR